MAELIGEFLLQVVWEVVLEVVFELSGRAALWGPRRLLRRPVGRLEDPVAVWVGLAAWAVLVAGGWWWWSG